VKDGIAGVQADSACREYVRVERQLIAQSRRQCDGLKCVYFNAISVKNKSDELRAWISTWGYDVVAISEI